MDPTLLRINNACAEMPYGLMPLYISEFIITKAVVTLERISAKFTVGQLHYFIDQAQLT